MKRTAIARAAALGATTLAASGLLSALPLATAGAATAPEVYSVSPATLYPGAASQQLHITGAGFGKYSKVKFAQGVTVASVAYQDAYDLTATVSVASGAATGPDQVTVTTAGLAGSCADCFAISDTPTVGFLSPGSVAAGSGTQTVTVNGSNFEPSATVSMSPADGLTVGATTWVSSTQLQVSVTPDASAPEEFDNVTVANTSASTSCAGCFEVTSSAPSISGVTPLSLPPGVSNQDIRVYGYNFAGGDVITAPSGSGVTINSTSLSYSGLIASVTVSATAPAGPVALTVSAPGGPSTSCAGCFSVNPKPVVTSATPAGFRYHNYGPGPSTVTPGLPPATSNALVYVQGSDFMPGAKVAFPSASGITVSSTIWNSSTSLTAQVDVASTAALQSEPVTVTNKVGTTSVSGSCTTCFQVSATPVVQTFGGITQGAANQEVYIGGGFFEPGATVAVPSGSGVTVNSVRFVDTGELVASVTASSTAPVQANDLTVTNASGAAPSGTCSGCLQVTSVSSTLALYGSYTGSGSSLPNGAANVNVSLNGSGFLQGATVSTPSTSGVVVNSLEYESSSYLIANLTVAANAPEGAVALTVTEPGTNGATVTCSTCFSINDTPYLYNVSTASYYYYSANTGSLPPASRYQNLYLNGDEFMPGAKVSFPAKSGIVVNAVQWVSASQLVVNVNVNSGAPIRAEMVTVTNPAGAQPVGACSTCFSISNIPTVGSVNPSAITRGTTYEDLTIYGTDYMPGATVTTATDSGITVNSVRYESPSEIVANVSVSSTAADQADSLTVTNQVSGFPSGTCLTCLSVTG